MTPPHASSGAKWIGEADRRAIAVKSTAASARLFKVGIMDGRACVRESKAAKVVMIEVFTGECMLSVLLGKL